VEARRLVEGHAAGRVWPYRTTLVGELEPRLVAMREARAAGDPIGLMEADRAFHAAIVDAAGNQILADLYHRLRDRQMRMGVASFRIAPERMDQAIAEHQALFDLLCADDPETWTAMVGQHVDTAGSYLRGLR
jgi:DNA-binding GntR family transcriptional regulator